MIFALSFFLTVFLSSVLCLCIMIQPVFDEVETIRVENALSDFEAQLLNRQLQEAAGQLPLESHGGSSIFHLVLTSCTKLSSPTALSSHSRVH